LSRVSKIIMIIGILTMVLVWKRGGYFYKYLF
jgi:hypothetical protein